MEHVSYEITKVEALRGFFYLFRNLSDFRRKICLLSLIPATIPLLTTLALTGRIPTGMIAVSLILWPIVLLVLPFASVVIARRGRRTVELVAERGLRISMHSREKLVPWGWIEGTSQNEEYLFVIGKSSNVLCIPKRSFSTSSDFENFAGNIVAHSRPIA